MYKKRYLLLVLIISIIFTACDKFSDGAMFYESIDNLESIDTLENTTDDIKDVIIEEKIYLDQNAMYATFSVINEGYATLYRHEKNGNGYVVAVNAGHGTKNGTKYKTYSHPDFSPKVAGGTNKEGDILSYAISEGTTLINDMKEADVNLMVAKKLKEYLLDDGYDVLMIRETDDARLDNVARTVIANENADIHIAIHFDSTENDKGAFYIVPYNDETYLDMEPLKTNAWQIYKLGNTMMEAFKEKDVKVWKDKGTLQGDLTQLSFSTNASIDLELGDKATYIDDDIINKYADAIAHGINKYFEDK